MGQLRKNGGTIQLKKSSKLYPSSLRMVSEGKLQLVREDEKTTTFILLPSPGLRLKT